MAHTPGPWYWVKRPKTKTIRLMGDRQLIVMDFVRWGMQSAQPRFIHTAPSGMEFMLSAEVVDLEADPNARLIKQAPELLEVLKDVRAVLVKTDQHGRLNEVGKELLQRVDAAIHKTECGSTEQD